VQENRVYQVLSVVHVVKLKLRFLHPGRDDTETALKAEMTRCLKQFLPPASEEIAKIIPVEKDEDDAEEKIEEDWKAAASQEHKDTVAEFVAWRDTRQSVYTFKELAARVRVSATSVFRWRIFHPRISKTLIRSINTAARKVGSLRVIAKKSN
jgi:tryptophan 2,3-dioxygenase